MLSITFCGTRVVHHVRTLREYKKLNRWYTMLITTNYRFLVANSKDGTLPSLSLSSPSSLSSQCSTFLNGMQIHTWVLNTTTVSNRCYKTRKRILPKGGDRGNGIKVHNQRDRPANWITVRCRLICIVSSTELDCTLVYGRTQFSLSLTAVHTCMCTRVYTIHSFVPALFLPVSSHQLKILSFTIQSLAPYSPCTETWYGIPTWHRNWFATTLLAASAPQSTLSSFVAELSDHRLGSPSYRCPDCQPVSGALVIGFPRFSQLSLKSHTTLFFSVLAPLSFDRVARALPRGKQAPLEEQLASEWETAPPLILSPQTLRSRYFVAKDRSRDSRSSIALLSWTI